MISKSQNILIHRSAAAWALSREDYVECLMEATGVASSKDFTSQGQFERAMAALELRAEILDTWRPVKRGDRPNYWRQRLIQHGGGKTMDGDFLVSSAQCQEIDRLLAALSEVHPRLAKDETAAERYLTSVMEGVTRGRCILRSAMTSADARRVIAALHRSVENWTRKIQEPVAAVADGDPF